MLSRIFYSGRVRKINWKMNFTRRLNHKKRLIQEDRVVKCVKDSGVKLKELDRITAMPTFNKMSQTMKYFVYSKKSPKFLKGVCTVPHFTKVPFLREFPKIVKEKYYNKSGK